MNHCDCHCHLEANCSLGDAQRLVAHLAELPSRSRHVMSTNPWDVRVVMALVENGGDAVVPYFGIHPWYSHLFSVGHTSKKDHYELVLLSLLPELLAVLPEPVPLEKHLELIASLASTCEERGIPYGVGEIGLDKLFRIPTNGYYGNAATDGVRLSSSRVTMEHQMEVFKRQLALAERLRVPVSLHCVKAHGPFFDVLHAAYLDIPCIVLHSYTGSVDQAQRWVRETKSQHRRLLFLFSNYINAAENKVSELGAIVELLRDDQLLVESDMPLDRFMLQGKSADYFRHLDDIVATLCRLRGWDDQTALDQLSANARFLRER